MEHDLQLRRLNAIAVQIVDDARDERALNLQFEILRGLEDRILCLIAVQAVEAG